MSAATRPPRWSKAIPLSRSGFSKPRPTSAAARSIGKTACAPRAQGSSPEKRIEDMDRMGIDIQAISPAPRQTYYGADPDLGLEASRAVNDFIADICGRYPDRFVGLGTVPFQAPELAVAELDRLHKSLGVSRHRDHDPCRRRGFVGRPLPQDLRALRGTGPPRLHAPGRVYRSTAAGRPLLQQRDRQPARFDGGSASSDLWRRARRQSEPKAGRRSWRRVSAGLSGPHRPRRLGAPGLLRAHPPDAEHLSEAGLFRRARLHPPPARIPRRSNTAPTTS